MCPLKKSDLSSLDFVINRFFMKLFNTGNIDTVKQCQMEFGCQLPSDLLQKRRQKFLYKIDNINNTVNVGLLSMSVVQLLIYKISVHVCA